MSPSEPKRPVPPSNDDASQPSFGSRPFARLSSLSSGLPAQPAPAPDDKPTESKAKKSPLERALSGRIVIARESKGRGGKTVVFARGIDAPQELLETLAKELRHELGTGVRVEDGALVVQGALTDRLAACLARRGAGRIVIGN
ncbi:MAG: translation initiation factor [Planctomycetes bacterium]|nr:translation initiation factor [Planctomycetota bacterium]